MSCNACCIYSVHPHISLFLTVQFITFGAPNPAGLSNDQLYVSTWDLDYSFLCRADIHFRSNSPVFWLNAIQWAGVCAPRTLVFLSLVPSLYLSHISLSALSPSLSPPTLPPVPSLYLSVSPSRSVCISLHPSVSPSSSPSLIRVQIGFSTCDLLNVCPSFLL